MAEEKINIEETEEVVKKRVKRSFQTIILDKVRARASPCLPSCSGVSCLYLLSFPFRYMMMTQN